jgi:hypothetical protein
MMSEAEVSRLVPHDDLELRAGSHDPAHRYALAESRKLAAAHPGAVRLDAGSAAELAELRQRVEALEAFNQAGLIQGIGEALRNCLPKLIERHVGHLIAKVDALQEEVEDLRARQVVFKGIFKPGSCYEKGSLVIHRGGLWTALETTTTPPGSSNDWQLSCKSGAVSGRVRA